MATPRRFSDYPVEYSELLRKAMKNPIRIPFPTTEEALRMRNHIYAFRKSIRDDPSPAVDDLILIAPLISFRIEDSTLIVYRPKRTSNIRKALDNVGKQTI